MIGAALRATDRPFERLLGFGFEDAFPRSLLSRKDFVRGFGDQEAMREDIGEHDLGPFHVAEHRFDAAHLRVPEVGDFQSGLDLVTD